MKILKFGGTSVGSANAMRALIAIVGEQIDNGIKPVVVVSAMSGVTDRLLATGRKASEQDKTYLEDINALRQLHFDTARELIADIRQNGLNVILDEYFSELEHVLDGVSRVRELSARTSDTVVSLGERLSATILAAAFQDANRKAEYTDARQIITTNENFGFATVDEKQTHEKINQYFAVHDTLCVVTGFIGSSKQGETTTLGRGGSDYTAAILAAALSVEELEIWTDVDGVMTADPRKVKRAFPLPNLSYEEAMELSHFGAKIIYPPTILPAMRKGIPIIIRNTFNPTHAGTRISKQAEPTGAIIKGISSIDKVALLTIQGSGMIGVTGVSKRLFGALASVSANVILISQASSEHSISFAVSPEDAVKAQRAVEQEFELELMAKQVNGVEIENDLSIIAVVGENMKRTPGIAGKLFSAMGSNGINVAAIAQGSSELNISLVTGHKDLTKALNVIHDAFFLSDVHDVYVFVVGTGTIGKTLLQQIIQQHKTLLSDMSLNVRVAGISNSRKMLLDAEGIELLEWENQLNGGEEAAIDKFVQQMIALNLPNSIFVDCTASGDVPAHYQTVLSASIPLVTPNKVACSGEYETYRNLKQTAAKQNTKFLYETNVGAGLPVISTLNDLIKSGDKVTKVEAVLSGTLNFIFNNLSKEVSFSKVVKMAKDQGYSEPDPRIDLSGKDVARKILILARECGTSMEFDEVLIANFLPEHVNKAESMEEFWSELLKADAYFENLRAKLALDQKKLKYVAVFENGKAFTELREVSPADPLYNLEGKDNIVLYTTARYNEQPLIVRGAGAGAEVTAAGVFADIIRIAR